MVRGLFVAIMAVTLLSGCTVLEDDPATTATPSDMFVVITAAPADDERPSDVYVVKKGDTLIGIANLVGVPQTDLIAANDLDDPDAIYAGQELLIPTPSP